MTNHIELSEQNRGEKGAVKICRLCTIFPLYVKISAVYMITGMAKMDLFEECFIIQLFV